MFAIYGVNKIGEPHEPILVISMFSNACTMLVRGKVDFMIQEWKKVHGLLWNYLWEEIKRIFTYARAPMKSSISVMH